jgi:acyl-CoA hydrolase
MEHHDDVKAAVDRIVELVGRRVVVCTPLGLGKANAVVDELYHRALADPAFELEIVTALGLVPPQPASELARRLVEPINERLFADCPTPRYEVDLRRDEVPPNVVIRTFFVEPGSVLHSAHAQRHHVTVNYADAAQVVAQVKPNVLAQMVAPGDGDDATTGRVSLSCNPDLTRDVLATLEERRAAGEVVVTCAEVNRNLPYMVGDAEVGAGVFDLVVDVPGDEAGLFGPPKRPLSLADHAIGLHASSLIRDGGTLQIGIGTLGDAVVWSLMLRHDEPVAWEAMREAVAGGDPSGLSERVGGAGPFAVGLYGCSEMLVDGFLDLIDAGVVRRRVYDDPKAQRRADRGKAPAPEAGPGHLVHAAFFLGPRGFYDRLRDMPDDQRALIGMTSVRFTNTLDGDRALKEAQRRDARFLNTALQVTLLGATLSDAVDPARVVSGVGGQHDFVTMAYALPGARSVTMVRATRTSGGRVTSNIVWDSRHVTVPRHQRDIVVTEYGMADLRGRSQSAVAAALVEVADSRFQDELVASAQREGILPADYRVPDRCRSNTPAALARTLAPHRASLPSLPFGTDLTEEELILAQALGHVAGLASTRGVRSLDLATARRAAGRPPKAALPYLARLGLDHPRTLKEQAWQRLVTYGLALVGALDEGDER